MKFILGETKEVKIEVISTKDDPFTIRAGTYTLKRVRDGELESSGAATINGHEVAALVTPTQVGVYTLELSYEIASEKLKAQVGIEVRT
jgi:hypothetical protein